MTYFVKVDGDSMIGAQIFPNSILVVDSVEPVLTGKVIVAWVEEDLCVRRFIRKNKMIVLEAANENYMPIYLHMPKDRHKLRVLGCVLHIVSQPPKYNHVWIG